MKTIIKVALGLGSAGTLVGTGIAVHHFASRESIENYLTKINEKNKVFLTSNTENLTNILDAYESSKRFKPQDEEGKSIKKDKLTKWCEKAIKDKYSGEDDNTFKGVKSWCYINTNSFEKELEGTGKTKITETTSTNKDWVDAWANYARDKASLKLEIKGHTESAKLNGQAKEEGQQALMKWCNEKASSKMYLDDANDDFNRFKNWCAK